MSDHKIAIYADSGIYSKVDSSIWDLTLNKIVTLLRAKENEKALKVGLEEIGNILAEHFPPDTNNLNELSNEISFGLIQ